MQNHTTKTIAAGFTALLLVTGCQREQVQVYRVDSDAAPQPIAATTTPAPNATQPATLPASQPEMSGAAVAPETTAPITYKTPDGWTEVPPTQMRVASFKITQAGQSADVSVVPLGGMAGGDDDNVNRWRTQVGLTAESPDDLQKIVQTVQVGGQPASLYDLSGTSPGSGDDTRIIGVIQHRNDTAWFFKMTGDSTLVEQQKPALIEFLGAAQFADTGAAQTQMPATLPPGHPDISSASAAANSVPISHEGQPNWLVPSGWREISGGQFLIAKFLLTGDAGALAAVNVSRSAGDGGGLAANVNRWRGQLGLTPATDNLSSPIDVAGGQAALVDISGTSVQTGQPTQLVGVIVPQGDNTWFYKLMGDAATVQNQKDAFLKFVQGTKY